MTRTPASAAPSSRRSRTRLTSAPVRGAGTEVLLRWEVPPFVEVESGDAQSVLPGDTVLALRPEPTFASAAGRVLYALGSRAGLAVDRLADLQLIGETLIAHAGPELAGSRLSLAVLQRRCVLQVSAGPFRPGGAEVVRRARSVAGTAVVDRLASDVEILRDPYDGHEVLVLTVGP